MIKRPRKYGWNKDKSDPRDFRFSAFVKKTDLPRQVNNNHLLPTEIGDQGRLGSCTAAAFQVLVAATAKRLERPLELCSRLYGYYNTRRLEGTLDEDSGAQIRTVFKAANRYGYCDESLWPYVIKRFRDQPPDVAYRQGAEREAALRYERVPQTADAIQSALAQGNLIECGFYVPASYESKHTERTGIIRPAGPDEAILGGHAICIVSYDSTQDFGEGYVGYYRFRNSYGHEWGDGGDGYLPFEMVHSREHCDDFWTLLAL